MFDVSFVELMVIGVVALIVLGPEKLPIAARTVGSFVRKARSSWNSVRGEFEREFAAEELKRSMRETRASLDETARAFDVSADVRKAADEIRESVTSVNPMRELGHANVPNDAAPTVPSVPSDANALPFDPVDASVREAVVDPPAPYSPTATYDPASATSSTASTSVSSGAEPLANPTEAPTTEANTLSDAAADDAGEAPGYRPHG